MHKELQRCGYNDKVAPARYYNNNNNEMSRTGIQYDLRAIYSVLRPSGDYPYKHPPDLPYIYIYIYYICVYVCII